MMPIRMCKICGSKPTNQKSHHKTHLNSKTHKLKRKLFVSELEKMTPEKRVAKYGSDDVERITTEQENYIKQKKIKLVKPSKKTISGNIIWKMLSKVDSNEKYNTIKFKLDSKIKQCHNLLYGKGGSIVGTKAQNDIMRVLCLKILHSQFNDENSELWERCNIVKKDTNMSDTQFVRFKTYCNDITEITKKDDVFKEWKMFVNKFLSKIFPSIYYENDNKFNCDKSPCIIELIITIDSLVIDDEFKDAFSTTCGDIHESFRTYGGKNSGAKALGQFFTPRHLIHLMFHGIGLDKLIETMDNITIYDPCMGTGGFLTRLFKMCNIPSENIFGCETEIDTIKFGEMSMVLTTGNSRNNIIKCDSLCENNFILDMKFKAIVTNPPFGTRMNYKNLKETFETKFPDSPVKFEDIYPMKTNNGACLFVQHCVYMLAEGGFCAIVLPDGELFEGNSKWSKTFRKWLSEKVNIRTILKVASGTFEHAGVKTNVVVFTKDGSTKNIRFMETPKECNVVKDMFTISSEELKGAGYSLDVGEYLVEETDNYDVPMVALGEVCDIQNGYAFKSNDYKSEGNPIITIKNITNCGKIRIDKVNYVNYNIKYNKFIINQNDILIALTGATIGKIGIFKENTNNYYLNQRVGRFTIKDNINKEYFYYWLLLSDFKDKIILNSASGERGNISTEVIKTKIKIPLPSLEVQQQIVDELSQIETSIETIESRITQLKCEKDQYKKYGRKAEIRELLKDSEEKMLGEVCEFIKGKTSSSDFKSCNTGNYPVISKAKYVNNFTYIDEYAIDGKNLFICDTFAGDGTGELTIHYYSGKCSYTNLIHNIKHNESLNTKYLYYYLTLDMSIFNSKYQKGSSKPTLDKDKLKKHFKIPIPTQEVQQQCISLFEEKEKCIQSMDEKINSEKEYISHLKQMAKDVISSLC